MEPTRKAERLTIYLSQTEHKGPVPDYVAIVDRARRAGLAGATVIQGVAGFGISSRVHRRHTFEISEDVPVAVTIIDSPERIEAFLATLEPLLGDDRVVRQPTEIVIERPRRLRGGGGGR